MNTRVYLDNSATTKVDDDIINQITDYMRFNFANPSSVYKEGRLAKSILDKSRLKLSNLINSNEDEIYFTSGGTEADNWAIKSIALKDESKKHIITTKIEHSAVLNTCEYLSSSGYEITYLDVDENGFVSKIDLEKNLRKDTALVSIMTANNEIGTIQDIKTLCEISHRYNAYFHTDAVQSLGKMDIDVKSLDVDMMSFSAHKIHALKGTGALYVKKSLNLENLIHGGSQENSKRAGTENVVGIMSFGLACEKLINNEEEKSAIKKLRDYFIKQVEKRISNVRLAGDREKRLINNVNLCFKDIDSKLLIVMLDKADISASVGSACMSGSIQSSYVIKAINMDKDYINGNIRFSLSKYNTKQEIDYTVETLEKIIKRLRN